ncbi:DUF368 domain-containing protein [Streptococcus massiliensis]|nr:DUF368 domain-containing protein [Streptococcus massiliensis]
MTLSFILFLSKKIFPLRRLFLKLKLWYTIVCISVRWETDMNWFIRVVKGMIIALGFILPGISGGVLAALLGIYERMIAFLAHLKQDFIENCLYFLPVGLGMILGIACFSYPVEFLLKHYPIIVLWGFAGAIIGTLPSLIKESTSQSPRDRVDTIWFWATLILSAIVLYFLHDLTGNIPINFLSFLLAGALLALGILVPGLSPSNLLLILGLYGPMLSGFKHLDLLGTFLPIGLGAGVTLLLFSKGMDYALTHYHSRVYHFILGIVLASTILIVLPQPNNPESLSYSGVSVITLVLAALFFSLGIWLGIWMSKLEEKYK